MNRDRMSPFSRPGLIAVLLFAFSCVQSGVKGSLSIQKALLLGGWFGASVVVLAVFQIFTKTELGWRGAFIGVITVSLAVAAISLYLRKSGFVSL